MKTTGLHIGAAACLAITCGGAAAGGLTPALLMAGGWCSSTYNSITNVSAGRRVVFRQDGTYVVWQGSEMHAPALSSGHSRRIDGYWRVTSGELFLNEGRGFEHLPTQLKVNSSGWPIIMADGSEYVRC